MDLFFALALQVLYAIANLVLISIGLAIIFGMMRVINLAHGEFLMLGGYTVVVATNNGVNLWLAMLVLAPLVVGAISDSFGREITYTIGMGLAVGSIGFIRGRCLRKLQKLLESEGLV